VLDEDSVRSLIAQQESAWLDFKKEMYDWRDGGDAELAKDIMAIANLLPRGADKKGYILVGVEEVEPERTGNLLGFTPDERLGDAEFQEKVKDKLNRQPRFRYAIVPVAGKLVGVFEISSGERPYFALKDFNGRGKLALRRNAAYYRTGARNDVASPAEILSRDREDNPARHRLVELQLAEAEAKAKVRPRLVSGGTIRSGDQYTVSMRLENDGDAAFMASLAVWHWRIPADALRAMARKRPRCSISRRACRAGRTGHVGNGRRASGGLLALRCATQPSRASRALREGAPILLRRPTEHAGAHPRPRRR
jgi:hypothetical protein